MKFYVFIIQGIFVSKALPNSVLQKCNNKCDESSYCDGYENSCQPCSEICDTDKNPSLTYCNQNCPHYLHSVISAHKMDSNQLQTLTIMVALTAVMTCLVLVLLTSMMIMKIKKKKRIAKKVLPSTLFTVDSENIKIMDSKMANLNPKDLEISERKSTPNPTQNLSRSVSTVVTQVSQESSQSSSGSASPQNNGLTLPDHSNSSITNTNRPKRFPSEDCVPNYGRCQPTLDSMYRGQTPRHYSEVV